MSGYYYTDMRNVFVGSLCALGAFLGAYDGYDDLDRWITNIAGFCAIGVAFCPTKPTVCVPGPHACPASSVAQLSTSQQVVGDIHVFFAVTTFIMLGLIATHFRQGGKDAVWARLILENFIYRASGITILSCVLLAVLSNLLPALVNAHWPLLFIFEAVAVLVLRSFLVRQGPDDGGDPESDPVAMRAVRSCSRAGWETGGAVPCRLSVSCVHAITSGSV